MDTFFTLLKKGLVATMFVVFAFVATYIPQPYNNVNEVHAGGAGGPFLCAAKLIPLKKKDAGV